MAAMLRHHFDARLNRLKRLIAKGEARLAEVTAKADPTPIGKRARTLASNALARHRKSLAALLKAHGAEFGVQVDTDGKPEDGA
jgi:hypothetical protein